MRRVLVGLIVIAIAIPALFALLVALLPRDALKARIGEEISSWTGRDVSLRGEPEVGLLPLRVMLHDVRVSGLEGMQDAPIVTIERLTGTMRLLPLLIGRIEIGSFVMERPVLSLVRDAESRENWDFDAGAAALQLAFAGDVPLGNFAMRDGTVLFEDRGSRATERLDGVSLSMDWPSVRRPIAIDGSGTWRGEPVRITASAANPFSFIKGDATPVEASISSALINATFSGTAEDYPDTHLDGALQLTTPSLRGFASWLGSPIGAGPTLGAASLSGTASWAASTLSVGNAQFTLDGNAASGALTIAGGPRPVVTGTLAYDTIDISTYLDNLRRVDDGGSWRTVRLPTAWFRDVDADIRLSADTLVAGRLTAGATAASLSMRDGRMEIGLANMAIGDGSLAGEIALADREEGAALEAQLRASDVALAGAAPVFGLTQITSGTLDGGIDLATRGRTLGEMLAGLSGTGHASLVDASVPLLGIDALAAGAARADNGTAPSVAAVTRLDLALAFDGGLATVTDARVDAPSWSASANGTVGLAGGRLALSGAIAAPVPDDADPPPAPAEAGKAFRVEGTLSAPVAVTVP